MPKRTKILFVIQLPPPVHGASVMNQLVKDSTLINTRFSCDYVNLTTAKNVDDLQKNRFSKYFSTLAILFRVFSKLLFNRYQSVYITLFPYGPAFIKDSVIILVCRFFGYSPVLHLHTYGFKKNARRSPRWKRYYRFVFKNTQVVCLSDRLIEDVEEIYSGHVNILPNGIPQVNFQNNYVNNQEPLTLLFLSNLIKGKGILILIEALAIIHQKGIPFNLRVVGSEGDVTYRSLKELAAEKGILDQVVITGPKYGAEKYAEFSKAGIFLLPSDYDTFGLVLLEAMQFGVPCISTNIGAIPYVLGDGRGLIIDEISAPALAVAIEKLISNPQLREEMSARGFEFFSSNFTDSIFEKRLASILQGQPEQVDSRLLTKSPENARLKT